MNEFRGFVTIEKSAVGGNLSGHFLAASPNMDDPIFKRSFILICAHDEDGTFGIRIDKEIDFISAHDVYKHFSLKKPKLMIDRKFPILDGGPVDKETLLVVSITNESIKDFKKRPRFLIYANSELFLKDYLEGQIKDQSFLLCKGYCAWTPGQLEAELEENSWIVLPPDYDQIFSGSPARRWNNALKAMRLDGKKGFVNYSGQA